MFENIICEYLLLVSTKKANRENGDCSQNHLPYYYGFRAFGTILGGFYGGRIIDKFGVQECFYLNSLMPILVVCISIIFDEWT